MSAINDGVPAFPVGDGHGHRLQGMTLRDYFGAAALQGLLADPNNCGTAAANAIAAYQFADAMLAQRARKEEQP